jgi:hypothetical protein
LIQAITIKRLLPSGTLISLMIPMHLFSMQELSKLVLRVYWEAFQIFLVMVSRALPGLCVPGMPLQLLVFWQSSVLAGDLRIEMVQARIKFRS